MDTKYSRTRAGLAVVLLGASSGLAAAQDTGTTTTDQKVEKVVVTATKREKQLQDVPVAVTAVDGNEAAAAGVTDTERLAQVVPSLFITSSQQVGLGAQIRVRGVGTATGNPGLEGSVGFFVDGVNVGRSNTAFSDLVDVKRIEVLRGPQGTLFGKSTSAGVINVITRLPDWEWGGHARASVSTEGGFYANGRVSGPLVDDVLAFSLTAQGRVRDGYINDVVSGADYNDRNRWLGRAQLLFQPSDDLSLRFIVDHSERNEHSTVPAFTQITDAQRALIVNLGGTVPNPPGGSDHFDVAVNGPFTADTRDTGYTAIADWSTSFADLRGIVAYRDSLAQKDFDTDFTNVDIFRQTDDLNDRVFSAELQATREIGAFDLLLGFYYFDTETDYDVSRKLGTQAGAFFDIQTTNALITAALWEPGRGLTLQDTVQEGDGWSIFTHDTWHVTPRFHLTAGLRYQSEEKTGGATFTYNQATACTIVFTSPPHAAATAAGANGFLAAVRPASFCAASTPNFDESYSDDQLTGTFIAAFDVTDDIFAYASYARGFKAGGINLDSRAGANAAQSFLPEAVDSYEIGLKTQFFGGAVTANAAAFTMKFHDFQLNSFSPATAFVLTNEASVTSEGVELEAAVRLTEGLWVRGGGLYNEAQYGEDTANPALRERVVSNAPKWSGTLGVSYDRPVFTGWTAFGRLDGRVQTEVFTASNLAPATRQNAYGVLNGRFGMRSEDGWEFAAFGTNLTDTRFKTIAFTTTGGIQSYFGEPLYLGFEVSKQF